MAKGVGVFKRKRSIKALYRFFKNESLRFYLYDVINLESSIIKKGHLKYNPFVIYLMHKHNFIFLNNTKWWSMNRHNLKTEWILDELVDYWNKKQERKLLNVDQVREMITTSFKLMLANPDDYNPRYVQFENKQNLEEYFKVYFNYQEYDSDDSDNEIDNIDEPEHNVVEDNQNENDNDNNEVTEEYLDEFYDESHVNDLEYGHNTDVEMKNNVHDLEYDHDIEIINNSNDLEYGHDIDLEYGHNSNDLEYGHNTDEDVEMKNNVHDLEYGHDSNVEMINNSNDLEYGHNFDLEYGHDTDLEYGHNTDNDVKMINNVNDRENNNDNFEVIEEYLDQFYDDSHVNDLEYGRDYYDTDDENLLITIYFCDDCGKSYDKKKKLTTHIIRTHAKNLSLLNKIKAFDNEGKKLNKNFVCEICGSSYLHKIGLIQHFKNIHNIYYCNFCSLCFNDPTEFVEHSRNDHKMLRYHIIICDICGEKIPRFGKASVPHIRNHMEQICLINNCGKKFSNCNALNSHKTIHYKNNLSKKMTIFKQQITCPICKLRFNSYTERIEHQKTHINKFCDICEIYNFSNVADYTRHKKTCSPDNKLKIEREFVEEMNDAFDFFQNKGFQSSSGSSSNLHANALFNESYLFKRTSGIIDFDDRDGFPFWREDLYAPLYGSFSYNVSKMSENDIRNANVMHPFYSKVYAHELFPIGQTVLIKYSLLARVPEYSFQLFDLKLWKTFRASGMTFNRNNFPFKKNFELPAFMQKRPELYAKNIDRGHLTPYYMACSAEDQQFFQLQGNIFPQLAPMNRGKWKSLEHSIPNITESCGASFAHVTTGIIYARDNYGSIIFDNGIMTVEYYFKVIFYADHNNKPFKLDCFLVKQHPVPDNGIQEVTLFDIDSLKNNHLLFLNSRLIDILPPQVKDFHRVPISQHKK